MFHGLYVFCVNSKNYVLKGIALSSESLSAKLATLVGSGENVIVKTFEEGETPSYSLYR